MEECGGHSAEAEMDSQAGQLLLADAKIMLAMPMIHSYGGVGYSLGDEEVK